MINNISQIITLKQQQKISKYHIRCDYRFCASGGHNKNIRICKNCGSIMCRDCMRTDRETCLNCSKLICHFCKINNSLYLHICQGCNIIFCHGCTNTYKRCRNVNDICELSYYCKNC